MKRLFQHLEQGGLQSQKALPVVCLRWYPAPVARLRGWGQSSEIAFSSVWSKVGCSREKRCLWCV